MPRNSNAGNNSGNGGKYNNRRWYIPSKRAKSYADERKAKVHQHGPKEGSSPTTRRASVQDTCRRSPTTQPSTSTKRLFPRARASKKRAKFRSAEAEINRR